MNVKPSQILFYLGDFRYFNNYQTFKRHVLRQTIRGHQSTTVDMWTYYQCSINSTPFSEINKIFLHNNPFYLKLTVPLCSLFSKVWSLLKKLLILYSWPNQAYHFKNVGEWEKGMCQWKLA